MLVGVVLIVFPLSALCLALYTTVSDLSDLLFASALVTVCAMVIATGIYILCRYL
jgi:hypothetical protein